MVEGGRNGRYAAETIGIDGYDAQLGVGASKIAFVRCSKSRNILYADLSHPTSAIVLPPSLPEELRSRLTSDSRTAMVINPGVPETPNLLLVVIAPPVS